MLSTTAIMIRMMLRELIKADSSADTAHRKVLKVRLLIFATTESFLLINSAAPVSASATLIAIAVPANRVVVLENPENACAGVNTPVNTIAATARIDVTTMGITSVAYKSSAAATIIMTIVDCSMRHSPSHAS